jgi:hypothetical protein
MDESSFNSTAAVIAGLAAGAISLVVTLALLLWRPRVFPLHPLYLVGSVFTIETTAAILSGLVAVLVVSAAYGTVIAALFNGFDASSWLPLWGAVAGAALSILTGVSLAYFRTVSPAARKGLVGDPGPFLLRYGKWQAAAMVLTHIVFGAITGALYDGLR